MKNSFNCYPSFIGFAMGDALGVPVEFKSRSELHRNPVTDLRGFGTHHQPPGTWSDDSSMTFCTAESICSGTELHRLANSFCQWKNHAHWTPHGTVFDIGIQTTKALDYLHLLVEREDYDALNYLRSNEDEYTNGNGSLMRILPFVFTTQHMEPSLQFEYLWKVSSLTHPHIRAAIACWFYVQYSQFLLQDLDKFEAFYKTQEALRVLLEVKGIVSRERAVFERILKIDFWQLKPNAIASSGYVIHTLEASLWCLLTSTSYEEAVLKAINLGDDTDTTGAVTGGLAGLYFGIDTLPKSWLLQLARLDDIQNLCTNFNRMLQSKFS